jgi:hypothetical protein
LKYHSRIYRSDVIHQEIVCVFNNLYVSYSFMGQTKLLFGATCALLAPLAFGSLEVQVDPATAAYSIQVDGATWFESNFYALRYNGTSLNRGTLQRGTIARWDDSIDF